MATPPTAPRKLRSVKAATFLAWGKDRSGSSPEIHGDGPPSEARNGPQDLGLACELGVVGDGLSGGLSDGSDLGVEEGDEASTEAMVSSATAPLFKRLSWVRISFRQRSDGGWRLDDLRRTVVSHVASGCGASRCGSLSSTDEPVEWVDRSLIRPDHGAPHCPGGSLSPERCRQK